MSTYLNKHITLDTLRKANSWLFKHSSAGIAANECTVSNPYLLYKWENIRLEDHLWKTSTINPNGHLISFLGAAKGTAKFSIPGNIMTRSEKLNYWQTYTDSTPYISLEDRTFNYTQSVDVFVNRVRVDKTKAYITVFDGSLDLYIPKSYFDANSDTNFLWVYVNQFETEDTFREYRLEIEEDNIRTIEIPLDDSIKGTQPENFYVYVNGYEQIYLSDYRTNFLNSGTSLRLIFDSISLNTGDVVVVTYEKDVRFMQVISSSDNIIHIPDDERDFVTEESFNPWYNTMDIPLQGWPICEYICDFVVNGWKVDPAEVTEIAPRFLKVPESVAPSDGSTVNRIQVKIKYPEPMAHMHPHPIFKNYIHQFIKYRNYSTYGPKEALFMENAPDWVANLEYPAVVDPIYGNYDPTNTAIELDEFLGNKIVDRINNDHCDNILSVLEQFEPYDIHQYYYGENLANYIREDTSVEGMGTLPTVFDSPKVVFSTMIADHIEDYEVLVFIDGYKIRRANVITTRTHNRVNAYVDADLVTSESRVVLWVIPVYNRDSKSTYITKENGTWNTPITFSIEEQNEIFGDIRNFPDDLYLRLTSDHFSYHGIDSSLYSVDIEPGEDNKLDVTITVDDSIGEDGDSIYIFNASITAYRVTEIFDESYVNSKQVSMTVREFDEDGVTQLRTIPKFNNYTIMVFLNGKFLYQDKDWVLIAARDNNSLTNISVRLLVDLEVGDYYEIYFTENYYQEIFSLSESNSAYGIIPLDGARLPYDYHYLDLYVNGKLIDHSNIQYLTSKLIRIRNEGVPLRNIRLYSKFHIGLHSLEDFIEAYEESEDKYFEWIKDEYLDDDNDKDIDDWYEDFTDEDDLDPNPPSDEEEDDETDIGDILEELLEDWDNEDKSEDSDGESYYYMPRVIDCNVFNIFEILSSRSVKYRDLIEIFYPEEEYSEGECDLILDMNITTSKYETYEFDADLYSKYDPSNVDHLTPIFMEHRTENEALSDQILNNELDNEAYYSYDLGMWIHPSEYHYIGELLGYK